PSPTSSVWVIWAAASAGRPLTSSSNRCCAASRAGRITPARCRPGRAARCAAAGRSSACGRSCKRPSRKRSTSGRQSCGTGCGRWNGSSTRRRALAAEEGRAMSLRDIINRPFSEWMKGSGPDRDVVLGSRIRLARNVAGVPFPAVASDEQLEHVLNLCREAVENSPSLSRMQLVTMNSLTPLERQILVERHLVSPQHTKGVKHKAVILRDDEAVSVMINEEDHVRIQVLMPGQQLPLALDVADRVDEALEEHLPYAFTETRGYLTACPTNVGTGLRASLMVHLPALVMTDQINRIITAVGKFGLTVRGLYGEGTEAVGNIF